MCVLQGALQLNERVIPQPPLLQLSAEKLTREGAFLLDCGSVSATVKTTLQTSTLFCIYYTTLYAHYTILHTYTTLYSSTWFCITLHNSIQLHTILCNSAQLHTTPYSSTRFCITVHNSIQLHMILCNSTQLHTPPYYYTLLHKPSNILTINLCAILQNSIYLQITL